GCELASRTAQCRHVGFLPDASAAVRRTVRQCPSSGEQASRPLLEHPAQYRRWRSMQMHWIKRQIPQREPIDEQAQQHIAQALRAIPAVMAEAQLSPQQSALVLAVSIGSMIAERFPEDHQLMMARLCAETIQKAMAANRREGFRPIPHAAVKATNC